MSSLSDLETMWVYIQKLGPECLALHRELDRVARSSADGYPSASFADGSPSSECDDDGTPLPQHSDPTFRAVLARNEGHAGQVQAAKRQVAKALVTAYRVLESAKGKGVQVLEPPERLPDTPEVLFCEHCESCGVKGQPVGDEVQHRQRAKRWGRGHVYPNHCDWCASFLHEHGRRPPAALVVKHGRGERIYDRDVREALTGK